MPDMLPHLRKHLRIHGLVQGVYYRASMVEQARSLGLSGWVRNRRDGSVEAVVDGPAEAVQLLVDWSHHGPKQARVDQVDLRDVPTPAESFTGFSQRPTE